MTSAFLFLRLSSFSQFLSSFSSAFESVLAKMNNNNYWNKSNFDSRAGTSNQCQHLILGTFDIIESIVSPKLQLSNISGQCNCLGRATSFLKSNIYKYMHKV